MPGRLLNVSLMMCERIKACLLFYCLLSQGFLWEVLGEARRVEGKAVVYQGMTIYINVVGKSDGVKGV